MQEGPLKLSWGKSNSRRLPQGTASGSGSDAAQVLPQSRETLQATFYDSASDCQPEEQLQPSSVCTPAATGEVADCWQQLPAKALPLSAGFGNKAASCQQRELLRHGSGSHSETSTKEQPACVQVQRAVLRSVLAAVLQEDGPQLDHYQLTVQAVAAIAQHKATEACSRGREEGRNAAALAHKQQLATAQLDAEQRANKLLKDACSQAEAVAAQHSKELASLQAQVSALQHEKRRLYGRTAQHARDAKQAAVAVEDLHTLLEQSKQQLQKVNKRMEAKEAALTRYKAAHLQDVAVLQASLDQAHQQAAAAAAVQAEWHDQQMKELCKRHDERLEELRAESIRTSQQQVHAACAVSQVQLQQQHLQFQQAVQHTMQDMSCYCRQLEDQVQQAMQALRDLPMVLQDHVADMNELRLQLQELRSELLSHKQLQQQLLFTGRKQHMTMQALEQQVAAVAPEGLDALQQRLECARRDHQAALQQLQDASLQHAFCHPTQLRLQQEKQSLQEQLVAAEEQVASLQQQIPELQQMVQQQEQQLLDMCAKVNAKNNEVNAAQNVMQAMESEHSAAVVEAAQQQAEHQQQVQQLLQQLDNIKLQYSEQVQELQQHLQWLCNSYWATPIVSGQQQCHSHTHTEALGSTSLPSVAVAVVQLRQLIGGDTDAAESRYEDFLKHKEQLLNKNNPRAGDLRCLQQQALQIEAGLLQVMLCLQGILQLLEGQQQQTRQQLLTVAGSSDGQQSRPTSASSKCSQSSTSNGRSHGGLARQLLQALAKEKRQLAQQVKKLQQQQVVQSINLSASLCLTSTARPATCVEALASPPQARLQAAELMHAVSCCSPLPRNAIDDDVDEVLMLLKGCQLTRQQSGTSSMNGAAAALRPEIYLSQRSSFT